MSRLPVGCRGGAAVAPPDDNKEHSMTAAVRRWCLTFVSLVLVAAASTPTTASEKVTFVMSWSPDARWAAEFLAKERGYFAQEGLEVNFVHQRGSLASLQQVGAGAAEFGSPDAADVI